MNQWGQQIVPGTVVARSLSLDAAIGVVIALHDEGKVLTVEYARWYHNGRLQKNRTTNIVNANAVTVVDPKTLEHDLAQELLRMADKAIIDHFGEVPEEFGDGDWETWL